MKKVLGNNFFMLKYIFKYCPGQIFVSIFSAILSSAISVIGVLLQRYVIQSISDQSEFASVVFALISFGVFGILVSLLNIFIKQFVIPKNTQIFNKSMQMKIFLKTIELDLECYEDTEFYNKFTIALQQSDTRALEVLDSFSSLIGSIFGISALITLIGTIEPIIIIFIVINVLISFAFNTKFSEIQHDYFKERILFNRLAGYAQRIFYLRENAKEIRLFNKLHLVISASFSGSVNRLIILLKKFSKKTMKISGAQAIINTTINSIITIYLAYRVVFNTLSIANFIALQNSAQQLASQISQLLGIFPQIYEHSLYINDFKEFMNFKSKISNDEGALDVPSSPEIELRNVTFTYPKTNKIVLNNINLKIFPGERVAFVGRNGAGKSTLVKLITRLYDPSSGELLINDLNYQGYKLRSLRDSIGVVFQDYQIFAVSIAENILMRPIIDKISDERTVINALKYVGLYNKVKLLSDGIYTIMTKEFDNSGAVFSGGELQKIVIARLYAKKYNILVLDEPSSALDPISEKEMFDSMLNISTGKTVILISHRLANVKNVDKIFYIEQGCLVEVGSHDELIELNGKYAEMYKAQISKFF